MFDPGGLGLVTDLSAAWIAALLDATLKGTVLLVLALLAARLLEGAPAAARHLVWATALVGLLALPVLAPLTPGLEVPFVPRVELAPPSPAAATTRATPNTGQAPAAGALEVPGATVPHVPAADGGSPAARESATSPGGPVAWATGWFTRTDPRALLGGVWLLGALCVLVTLLVGKARIRWLARDADRVRDGPWMELRDEVADRLGLDRPVVLLRGRRPLVPMTWGVLRPRVMLPETADTWPEACRRNVLLHELAHVRRRDCLVQLLARLTCALYWFHPLVWHAARRLRLEQEEACDDHVLRSGTLPSEYARQLVGLARLLRAVRTPAHAGSTGVGRSDFMKRMRALLDGGRSRQPLGRRSAAALGSAAGVLVLGLAAVRPAAPASDGRIAEAPDGSEPGPEDRAGLAEGSGATLAAVRVPGLELEALEVRPPAGVAARASGSGAVAGPAAEAGAKDPPRLVDDRARESGPTATATAVNARAAGGGAAPATPAASARGTSPAGATSPDAGPDRSGAAAAAEDRAVRSGDRTAVEAARGGERVAPLRSAFASYWHAAGDGASVEAEEAGATAAGGFASVTTSARELARRLARMEDARSREALLRRNVREGSTRSLAVVMEVSILADRPDDRVLAVRALADAPSGAGARFLYQVARANPWEDVRTAAARQLRRLAPERVVPWLVTLVYEDASPAVQRRAVTELARLDRRGVDASLMQIARSHPQADVRLEAIVWLLRTGSGQALTKYVENA